MATLIRTEMCEFHGPHITPLEDVDFEFATALVIVALSQMAELDQIPALVREWMSNDGETSFDIEFEDIEYGNQMVITYSV